MIHIKRVQVSHNVVFYENQHFFQYYSELTPFSILPNFSPEPFPSSIVRFKPNFVYVRRHKIDVPTLQPLQKLPPATNPDPIPQLQRSTCLCQLPDRYGFTHTTLLSTLSHLLLYIYTSFLLSGRKAEMLAHRYARRILCTTRESYLRCGFHFPICKPNRVQMGVLH